MPPNVRVSVLSFLTSTSSTPQRRAKSLYPHTENALAVSSASPNQEAAWEFIAFMTQEENIIPHLIACGMLPARKSLLDNEAYLAAMPHVKPLIDILPEGQYLGYFNTDVFKENINNTFIELTTTDTYATVADALAALEKKLNADLFGK